MKIGQIAAAAGVNVQTLRYYERRGLVKPTSRHASGYREYDDAAVDRVCFVRRAQELGFTLSEIHGLLLLKEDDGASCADVRHRTQLKIGDIDRRVQSLNAMKHALIALKTSCRSNGSVRYCPIIESLSRKNTQRKGRTK